MLVLGVFRVMLCVTHLYPASEDIDHPTRGDQPIIPNEHVLLTIRSDLFTGTTYPNPLAWGTKSLIIPDLYTY